MQGVARLLEYDFRCLENRHCTRFTIVSFRLTAQNASPLGHVSSGRGIAGPASAGRYRRIEQRPGTRVGKAHRSTVPERRRAVFRRTRSGLVITMP